MATLSYDTIEHVIGCKTAAEAWANLEDRYASVSKIGVNHLKAELHTMQKYGDSMDKYLLRIKSIRDQLIAGGEYIFDNDVMIATLAGLPKEYATIRTVILARESTITMKEFRALLLGAESENDIILSSLTQSMAALYMHNTSVGVSSHYNSGPSSSNSSASDPSSTGSTITLSHLPQQVSFGSQSQMGQPAYFPDQTSYGSSTGFLGHMDPSFDNSKQQQSSSNLNSGQQRFYNGGQSRGNGNYRSGYKGKGSNNYRNNSGWNGNTESRITLHHECQICQKIGHTAPTCLYRNSQNNSPHFMTECQICRKMGHIALECYHRANYSY